MALAMGEVEHAIADAQRFAGRMTSHNRTTRLAIGRSDATSSVATGAPRISIAHRAAAFESQRAGVVFLLVVGLIAPATERDPLA